MKKDMLRKIAVDPGFRGFRVAEVREGTVKFYEVPSVIGMGTKDLGWLNNHKLPHQREQGHQKPFKVSFGNVDYLVGPNVHLYTQPLARQDLDRLGEGPDLQALMYAVLFRIVNGGSHRVALLIGQPINVIRDAKQSAELLLKLRGWLIGAHEFAVDDQPVSVTVEQIQFTNQPVGSYIDWSMDIRGNWIRRGATEEDATLVIDIGHNTVDTIGIIDGELVGAYTRGEQIGMRRANEAVREQVIRDYGVEPTIEETDRLIRTYVKGDQPIIQHAHGDADVSPIVAQALDMTHVRILDFIERVGGKSNQFRHKLISGGGARALRTKLLRKFPTAHIPTDPAHANIRGLGIYAVMPEVFAAN